MLFGVSPIDPLTYLIAPALLGAAAVAASAVPAYRASRADPKASLQYE